MFNEISYNFTNININDDVNILSDVISKKEQLNISGFDTYKIDVNVNSEMLYDKKVFWCNLSIDKHFSCTYVPHLSPLKDMVVGQRAMRGAAIILESEEEILIISPNYEEIKKVQNTPYIMDYDKNSNTVKIGKGHHKETGHVYYTLAPNKNTKNLSDETLSFYIAKIGKSNKKKRDYTKVLEWIWEIFAKKEFTKERPNPSHLTQYIDYVYKWAFENWAEICWNEFTIDNQEVGANVFIVTTKQKPGLGKEDVWREPKSFWNQAWFCSLRSAFGYANHGIKTGNSELLRKGKLCLNFALSAPQNNGLFCSYFKADANNNLSNGEFHRSCPRSPENHEKFYHLLDNSWTCYWLLKWYTEIERDERILPYVSAYVNALIRYQQTDGSFPAWVNPDTGEISPYLIKSAEDGAHIMLLCLFYKITQAKDILESACKSADFIGDYIVPNGVWEDFETYWSCASIWKEKQFGVVDKKSGLYAQNTFGMYFCAQGMSDLYEITGKIKHLDLGEQILSELSLYQQTYRPHDFPVPTLGGFGCMNCDDEWNDARQSLIAVTLLKYYANTKKEMYLFKALWAMKASFYMMYCPENPEVKKLYETVHPHLNEKDYGFHMENFNHSDGSQVMGLGEFTIFDWGNGAAASSLIEFNKLYDTLI